MIRWMKYMLLNNFYLIFFLKVFIVFGKKYMKIVKNGGKIIYFYVFKFFFIYKLFNKYIFLLCFSNYYIYKYLK